MADQITNEIVSETTAMETNQEEVENGFILIDTETSTERDQPARLPLEQVLLRRQNYLEQVLLQREISMQAETTPETTTVIETENNVSAIRRHSLPEPTEHQTNTRLVRAESTGSLQQNEPTEVSEELEATTQSISMESNQGNDFKNNLIVAETTEETVGNSEVESVGSLQQTEVLVPSHVILQMEDSMIEFTSTETTESRTDIPVTTESTVTLQQNNFQSNITPAKELNQIQEPQIENEAPANQPIEKESTIDPPLPSTPLIMPIIFDGTIPWDEWLLLFDCATSMNNWSNNSLKLSQILMMSLRGPALTLCLTLPASTRQDYKTLRGTLSEALRSEEPLEVLIQQLQQRRRQPQETLRHLQVEVSRMVRKVYGGMENKELDQHARMAFLRCIEGSTYGGKTVDAQPKTLEEAVRKAEFYERRELGGIL